MKISVCKLCDETKELQWSHVIGKSIFKNILRKNGAHYSITTSLSEKKIFRSNDQWATYLLCKNCEELLNARYENYSLWALKNKQKGVKHQYRDNYLMISGVNQYRLIMYIISIFWRATKSDHRVFKHSITVDEIDNYLKKCILGESEIDSKVISVRVSKLACERNYYTQDILENVITNLVPRTSHEKGFSYFMIFSGYYFEILIGCLEPHQRFDLGILRKNKRILKVPYVDFLSIPEVFNYWKETKEIYENDKENLKYLLKH